MPLGGIFLICKFPISPRKILFSSPQKRGSGSFLAGGSDANSGKCGQRYLAYTIVRGGGRFLFEVFCQKPPRQSNEPCGGGGFFPYLFAPPPPPPPLPHPLEALHTNTLFGPEGKLDRFSRAHSPHDVYPTRGKICWGETSPKYEASRENLNVFSVRTYYVFPHGTLGEGEGASCLLERRIEG